MCTIVISWVTHGLFRNALLNFHAVGEFLVSLSLYWFLDGLFYSRRRERTVNKLNNGNLLRKNMCVVVGRSVVCMSLRPSSRITLSRSFSLY